LLNKDSSGGERTNMSEQQLKSGFTAMEEAIQTGRFFHAMTSFITSGRKGL